MNIEKDFLTVNEYSRPGKKLKCVKAVVMHWTANPNASAKANRDFFESKKTGMSGHGSAHYIVGTDGEIIQCIPEDEIAYHCGSSQKDPASGRIYTDEARERFGQYAIFCSTLSPNLCTIGIELCPADASGHFSDATITSAMKLCADILLRYGLTEKDITTHHDVVGWKDCPKRWTEHPVLFKAFCASVFVVMESRRKDE